MTDPRIQPARHAAQAAMQASVAFSMAVLALREGDETAARVQLERAQLRLGEAMRAMEAA